MSNKVQKTIEINAKVKASLEGMEKTVGELEKGLEKQQFDLSKKSGLSKLIKDYKAAKAELDGLMSGGVIARTDVKKAEQLGGKISRIYKQIGQSFEELQKGNDEVFRKLFPSNFTAQISKSAKAIDGFFAKLDSKSVKEGRLGEAEKDLIRLNDELNQIQNRRLKIDVDVDKDKVKKDLNRISQDLDQMREDFKKKLIPEEAKDAQGRTKTERLSASVTTWQNRLAQDTDARKNLKVQSLSGSQKSQITRLENQLVNAQGGNLADIEKKRLEALQAEQTKRATIARTPGARDASRSRREYGGVTDKELAAQIAASEKELKRLQSIVDKIDDIKQQPQRAYDAAVKKLETRIKTDRTNLDKAEKALSAHTTQREAQESVAQQKADDFMAGKPVAEATQAEIDALQALNKEKEESLELEKKLKQEKTYASQAEKDSAKARKESSIEKKKLEIQELKNAINNLANDTNFDDFFKKLQELGVNTEGVDKTRAGLEGIKKELDTLDENTLKEIREALKQMGIDTNDTDGKIDGLVHGMEQLGDTDKDLKRTENEMENLKNQVLQFFSLTNAVQLFRRAVTSALNTVKELDATMTEAAVVTEFDVGDMWNRLPEYAKEAQKLGVSINGMYQATTLYYQQGLKTNAAMQLGVETMKMAKIAGMDSTDATKAMTAALRGFNMELNEMSATKVNDVYSQLAAVTAADTNQIATAMEKTASIAASANMEFETTAALLAQIIETTQEAPETAGTAMKTIIARFSEVKSLKTSGQSTGQDEEGEGIDVNKIQTALRSVGISMDNFFAGTEGLDSVLLKLAEKWDSLDFETQRYIATMAAGSRQQSRFIAMMSDYSRTTELVAEAQNSADASQRQFNKTLESMESKLQRLSNAWDQFTMGLTNNEILKGAVDLLADMIEGVNKLTNSLSAGNGLIKSVVSLGVALGGLTMGKQVVNGLFGAKLGKTGIGQFFGFGKKDQSEPLEFQGQTGAPAIGFKDSFKLVTKKIGGAIAKPFTKLSGTKASRAGIKTTRLMQQRTKNAEQYVKDQTKALSPDDNSERAKSLRLLNQEIEKGNGLQGQTAESLKKIGLEIDNTNGQFKVLNKGYDDATISNQNFVQGAQKTAQVMGKMANGMFTAGAACAGLSAVFQAAGWDEGAEAMSKLSGIVMGLGAVFMVLPPIITGVGKVVATTGITAQAAWGWIGIIAALIVGLVIAIAAMSKANNGLAKDIEKTNSQIDQMTAATKEAEDALESITETRKELAEMQSTFAGLTKGTDEWRKALVDSNSKVLELLNTYPQLAEYIKPNEDGLMEVSTAGWEKLIKLQSDAIINTQSIAAGLQLKKANLELKQLEKNEKKMTSSEFLAKKTNAETQMGILATNFQTSAIASSNLLSNSDYADNAAAALGLEESTDEVVTAIETATKEVDTSKGNESELIKEYAELTGKQESDVKKQLESDELTKEDMAAAIGTQKVMQDSAKKMEDTARKISNISDKEVQKTVTKLLSKDGRGLKQSDLDKLKNSGVDIANAEAIQKYLSENAKIELSDEASQELVEILNNVSDAYATNFKDRLVNYGLDENKNASVFDFVNDTEYGVGKELVEKIGAISAEGGTPDQIESLIEMIQGSLSALSEDRTAALQMIADTNWESQESIAGMVEYLQGLDNADIEGLDNLGEEIKKLTDATSENTIAQLRDKGYSLSELIKLITSGEINEDRLTDDQKQQIKDTTGATDEDFIQTGTNQWQYKGDLYAKVVNLYADNTEAQKGKIDEAEANYKKATSYGGLQPIVTEVLDYDWKVADYTDEEVIERYGSESLEAWARQTAKNKGVDFTDSLYATLLRKTDAYMKDQETGLPVEQTAEQVEGVKQAYQQVAAVLNLPDDSNSLTTEQMLSKLEEWDKTWGNYEFYEKARSDALIADAELVQTNIASTTSEIGWQKFEDESDQRDYNEFRRKALKNRLLSTGGSVFVEELEKDVNSALEGTGKKAEDFTDAINGLASDMAVVSTKTKSFAENMSDLSENLNKDKRGSIEYGQALGQAKTNVASYFGISLDELDAAGISDEFYEKLAAGDSSALAQMQSKIANSVLEGYKIGSQSFSSSEYSDMALYLQANPVLSEAGMAEFKNKFGVDITNMSTEAAAQLEQAMSLVNIQISFQRDESGNISGVTSSTINRSGDYEEYYSTGGGGGSKWKNEYDKLYNNYEEVNKLLRERERIERDYDRLLKKHDVSGKKLLENQQQQLANLKLQREEQEKIQAGKTDEIQDLLASKKGKKYAKYYSYDATTGEINIDWKEVNKLGNKKGPEFDEFLSKLEGLRDQWVEAGEELENIDDTTSDIYDQSREDYLSFEERIKDAVVQARQDEIDKLSEINESINDTNGRILESMQEQIDEYRQNRDNEKTEQELSDKQRRLAYLQQDTSGANATEILKLQKEIEEGQESYTDQLIDQKISELQKQNDKAAEQRERQIQLMENQLDYDEKSGRIWDKVYQLWGEGVDAEGLLKPGSELEQVLRAADEAAGKSVLGEQQWKQELAGEVATAWAYVNGLARAQEGQKITFKTATGDELTGTADKHGNVVVDDHAYRGVSQDNQGNWSTKESTYSEPTEDSTVSSKGSGKIASLPAKLSEDNIITLQEGLNELLDDGVLSGYSRLAEDGVYGSNTKAAVRKLQKAIGIKNKDIDGIWGKNTRTAFLNSALKAYASGGLADFTGPAWLDGTKSRPEYILSADQTKAFFTLVDVLGGLSAHKGDSTENNRENSYDIDINVESIGSDYDVEQLANKVKSLINEDARYRNNNAINLMR